MKKTLLVTLDFYPSVGGIASYWKNLGAYMSSGEWVVLAPPLQSGIEEVHTSYDIYRKKFFSRLCNPHWFPLAVHIYKIVKKEKIQAIVVAQVLPVGTVVWMISKLLRIPYIVSVHGMDVGLAERHWRKKWLCKKILSDAQYVIANSVYTGSLVCAYGIPKERIEYVFPCSSIMPEVLQNKHIIPQELRSKKIILSVGRLVARKGFEYLIRAMSVVMEKEPNTVCVILGDGPMAQRLERLVQGLKLEKYVFFIHNASDDELASWYEACTVFVMAPYEQDGDGEGFGIVYLEANGFGKPVIGTRSGGVPEAVIDGKTGLLVAQRNSTEIAQAIIRLLSDRELADILGTQGRERVLREFQWSVQAEKIKKILR